MIWLSSGDSTVVCFVHPTGKIRTVPGIVKAITPTIEMRCKVVSATRTGRKENEGDPRLRTKKTVVVGRFPLFPHSKTTQEQPSQNVNTNKGDNCLTTINFPIVTHSRLFKMMKPASQDQLNQVAFGEHLKSYYNSRLLSETRQEANTDNLSSEIGEHDVLCGRGGLTNSHIGNKHYRQIVADHQGEYLKARKRDKIIIAQRIVSIVKGNGGRFLKRSADGESWVAVSDKKAQEKTSQALREGLDVRNNKVRPSKQIRRDDDSIAKTTVAHGKVRPATAIESEPSLAEEPRVPEPVFVPYERQISQSDIRDACEI